VFPQRSAVEKPGAGYPLFQQCKKARENVGAVGKPILRKPPLVRFRTLNSGVAGSD
jgi:hypothetical protein